MSRGYKSRFFAWSPLRNLMKKTGASIVARDAVDMLIKNLEEISEKITVLAIQFAEHAKRKKVTRSDIKLAIKYLDSN